MRTTLLSYLIILLTLLLGGVVHTPLYAQGFLVEDYQVIAEDSLLQLLETLDQEVPERVDVLNELAYRYSKKSIGKAKNFVEHALLLANYLDYTEGVAVAYYLRASIARKNHKYESAMDDLYKALDLVSDEAEYIETEGKIVREIANVFGATENYVQADSFYALAQEICLQIDNEVDLAIIIHNRGLANFRQEKYYEALRFASDARDRGEALQNDQVRGTAYRLLGEIHGVGFKDYKKALEHLEKSYSYYSQLTDHQSLTEVYFEMARNYIALEQLDIADSLLSMAHEMAEDLGNIYNLSQIYFLLSQLEEKNGEYQLALKHLHEANKFQDSTRSYRQYWGMADKQQEHATQQLDQEIQDNQKKAQNFLGIIIVFVCLSIFLGALLVVIFRINRQRKLTNLELNEKNNEIESINVELSQKNEEIAAQADWLKESNEQIKAQKDELANLNRMKDRMLSVISHDFRSPLNSLRGALMLLNSHQLPPDQLKMVTDDINNKLNRTLNLVDNLLQWTRNQLMGVEVKRQSLNMHTLVEETINLLLPLAETKKIALVNDVDPELNLEADLEMMKVVVRNLVSNAIKFTAKGGQVTVGSKVEESYLSMSVSDTGIGMPPEKVEQLFSLNTERSSLGTANEKGTGIGLLLCKEFVEKHGGHILVESVIEQGSTFTFSLPLIIPSTTEEEVENQY